MARKVKLIKEKVKKKYVFCCNLNFGLFAVSARVNCKLIRVKEVWVNFFSFINGLGAKPNAFYFFEWLVVEETKNYSLISNTSRWLSIRNSFAKILQKKV